VSAEDGRPEVVRPEGVRPEVVRPEVVRPEGWPRGAGYADGVLARGRVLAIAGQIGWDPVTQAFDSDDMGEQTARALANLVAVLRAAGGAPEHLVRLTWYVTSRDEYVAARARIGEAYRATIGRHFPAMSVVVVAGLLEPRAKVEIEGTAVMP
jgi:enamine deaminase RidA (YjgF/YER057c/UK114 family)